MNIQIRRRKKEDCQAISHIVTEAWNETYRGIVPDDFLDHLTQNEEERTLHSIENFNEKENHCFVLEIDSEIGGFVRVGLCEERDSCGEIHAIYLLKKYQGQGYGRKLLEAGIQELKEMGCTQMIIGCLEKNPSNQFYEHMGGKKIATRIFERLQLPENVYYFNQI